jgi:hypothetical protein
MTHKESESKQQLFKALRVSPKTTALNERLRMKGDNG